MRLSVIFTVIIVLVSCSPKSSDKELFESNIIDSKKGRVLVEKTYDYNSKGRKVLVKIRSISLDSTLDVMTEKFDHEKGFMISKRNNLRSGELNGPQGLYYKNGNIKDSLSYKNGKLDGKCFSYFQNGTIEVESSWENDIKIGEAKFYNEFGTLKEYRFFSPDGILSYLLKVSENAFVETGSLEPKVAFENINGKFFEGDSIQLKLFVPQPLQVQSEVHLLVKDELQREFYSDRFLVDTCVLYKPFVINQPGVFSFIVNSTHEFDGDSLKQNRVEFNIEVLSASE